jgi:Uma2 family endonuclease
MVDAIVKPYVTFADYLEVEQASDVKHEWFNGAIYAMSRGTPEHARLSMRLGQVVGPRLPEGCEIYSGDLMLYVAEVQLSTYADASIVCGPLETMTVKRNGKSLGEAVTNPTVIFEVLSESTERYDREEKFGYYRALPSLQEYVLVSQDEAMVEVFRRPAPGSPGRVASLATRAHGWDCERARAGGTVTIHGRSIEVDALYGSRG